MMSPPQCPVLSGVLVFLLLSACLGGEKGSAAPATQTVPIFRSRIWDVNQKSLYLQNNELLAGYLQGPNSALEEKIFWAHSRAFDRERFPVMLSIRDGRQCLACTSDTAWPVLQLENVSLTDLSKESREETSRFTFFRSYQDGLWQFESAAHPGWFLCTSAGSNEPLGLTQDRGPAHVVDFYFQPC